MGGNWRRPNWGEIKGVGVNKKNNNNCKLEVIKSTIGHHLCKNEFRLKGLHEISF